MTERNAIALPLEPLEVLSQQLNLISLDVYEERWKVMDKDAVAYLKRHMVSLQRRTEGAAERPWKTDDDGLASASPEFDTQAEYLFQTRTMRSC